MAEKSTVKSCKEEKQFCTFPIQLPLEHLYVVSRTELVCYSISPCYSWFYRSLSYPVSHLFLRVLVCLALPIQKPFHDFTEPIVFSQTAVYLHGCDQVTSASPCLSACCKMKFLLTFQEYYKNSHKAVMLKCPIYQPKTNCLAYCPTSAKQTHEPRRIRQAGWSEAGSWPVWVW